MKPPSVLSRLAGTPFIALVLFGVYAAVFIGFTQGRIPVWMAAFAVAFAVATGNSVIEVRHYKRWMAAWESMGNMGNQVEPRHRHPWLSMLMAVGALFYIPTLHTSHDETVTIAYVLIWLFSALYLVIAFIRMAVLRRSRKADKPARQVEAQTAPVEFMMGRASSSPSLNDATRNLPDYAAAMLKNRPDERS
jgi:hypothetical protein